MNVSSCLTVSAGWTFKEPSEGVAWECRQPATGGEGGSAGEVQRQNCTAAAAARCAKGEQFLQASRAHSSPVPAQYQFKTPFRTHPPAASEGGRGAGFGRPASRRPSAPNVRCPPQSVNATGFCVAWRLGCGGVVECVSIFSLITRYLGLVLGMCSAHSAGATRQGLEMKREATQFKMSCSNAQDEFLRSEAQ